MMIVLVEKYDLSIFLAKRFDDFDSTESSSDDDNAGFAQVRDASTRGNEFGHLKKQKFAHKRRKFKSGREGISIGDK